MEIVLHIVLVTIPAVAVIAMAYLMLKKFAEAEDRKAIRSLKLERQKYLLPKRVEAYQRMILFLDRVSPNSLIMRIHDSQTNAHTFHQKLLLSIREEFNHNVAQQLYLSSESWSLIENGKEQLIQLINTAADSLKSQPNATSLDLSQKIFEIATEQPLGLEVAKDYLKKEFQKLF